MTYIPVVDRGPATGASRRKLGAWTVAEYLTAFGIAIIAPILAFAGLLLHHYSTIEHAQLEQQVLQVVRALKGNIDRDLGAMTGTLEALATSPALTKDDYARFHAHAVAVAELRPNQFIILSDTTGRRLIDTRIPWGQPLSLDPDSGARAKLLESRDVYVSDLKPDGGHFTVSIPIRQADRIAYLLSLSVEPSRLRELVSAPNVPAGWSARIFDGQGRALAGSQASSEMNWSAVPVAQLSLNTTDDERVIQSTDKVGEDELVAIAQTALANWVVAVAVDPDLAQSSFWSWRWFALGGVSLLLLSGLLAVYFGRKLAKPIRETALAASAFGRGETVPQLGLELQEVNEVFHALEVASKQRQQAENELRAAHEQTMLALSATEMGTWERDIAANQIKWSEAMYRIFGRTHEQFSGDPDDVLSFVYPEDRARFREVYEDAIKGPADTFEHEARVVLPSGEVRWLYRRAFVRRKPGGQAVSVLGVAIDITERKEAENANAELAAIVASSSEAILSVSLDGTIATWNAGARQMFGMDPGDAIGTSMKDLLPEDRQADWKRLQDAMRAGGTIRFDTVCEGLSQRPVEVSITASPVHGVSRAIDRYSVTIRDISELKEHDRHLAGVMRELTHRSKNLLAVIQAMARQTALRSDSLVDFEARFSGRLQCLSRSHELLISHDWEGATLSDLVAVQRSSFGPRHSRIRASGPDVFLPPAAILNIGLALHELASNAERHGALSVPTGRVDLTWKTDVSRGSSPKLTIVWREIGRQSAGDLLHKGFGRDILEHVTPTALGGNVVLKSIPDGLMWSLEIPYDRFARTRRQIVA